jgi:hypothetical protein
MNDSQPAARAPVSFWLVTLVSLLWNAFGAFDYSMTKLRNADYLANFPPEMLPYLDAMPAWTTVFWALGVWGALAGSLLLLVRSRHAVTAFLVSLVGAAVSFAYQYTSDMPDSLKTPGMMAMSLVIVAGVVFFWWYARKVRRDGLLR